MSSKPALQTDSPSSLAKTPNKLSGKGRFVGTLDQRFARNQQTKALTIGDSIEHTGITATRINLAVCLLERFGTCAIKLVFPTDNPGIGKPVAKMRQDFSRRPETNDQLAAGTREFVSSRAPFDPAHLKIA